MTVQTTTLRADYTGNGTTTAFAVPFYFLDNTHIKVLRTQISTGVTTTLTLTTNYTVAGAGVITGGTVTCLVAPTADQKISILRNVPFTQLVDYVENDPFPANTHERALDQLTMETQQLSEEISRALTLPENSTGVSTSLPTPVAGNVIGWNPTGTGLQNVDQATLATLVASGSARADVFVGDGVTTVYTLTDNPGNQAALGVSVGGTVQTPSTDYIWTSGTTLIFTSAPPLGASVVVRYWLGLPQNYSDAATTVFSQAVAYGLGTVGLSLQATINVKDAPYNARGDGIVDDTAAIQAAINAAIAKSIAIGNYALAEVRLPAGIYKISSTIKTQGSPTTGQCAIRGEGQFLTVIKPSGDFTAINLATAYIDSGDFSIEWPNTAAASIPTTRIGVEFAATDRQVSQNNIYNIQVRNCYRGFILNDWTGGTLGTMWMCKLHRLSTLRCSDYSFWINSKTGSTTLHLELCYANGIDFSTSQPYGKGFYINNIDDVMMTECAIDSCLDTWVNVNNATQVNIKNIAFESDKLSNAALYGMVFQAANVMIEGCAVKVCTFDTGGNARVIYAGGTTQNMSITGYKESFCTTVAGTTRYKAAIGGATTSVFIEDDTIRPGEVLDNGYVLQFVYRGTRYSRTGVAPSYNTWLRGDYVRNGAPAVGSPKGWYCTASGTPGTWVSEGNL